MDWFRYYTATLEKRKIQDLPPPLFKAWVNLLCVARRFDGVIPALEDVAFGLRCSQEQAAEWLGELEQRKLLDRNGQVITPHDWNEHQYRSDNTTERVRKHRAKQARNVSVTAQSRADTETEQIGAPSAWDIAADALIRFPGADRLPGKPDAGIVGQCLQLAGGSPQALGMALVAMHRAGKRPERSWAFFPAVLPQFLAQRKGPEREAVRA